MTKILNIKDLKNIRRKYNNKKIVLVHGVFDIIHLGHIEYFKEAKNFGDILVASVTSDKYVKKGLNRPFFNEDLRINMLNELSIIDYIVLSNEPSSIKIIKSLKPNYYIKGPDYKVKENDRAGNLKDEEIEVKKNNGVLGFTSGEILSSTKILNYNFEKFKVLSTIERENKLKNIDTNKIYENYKLSLKKVRNEKILVIGEVILDNYLYAETMGMPSKENIISVKYEKQKNFLGGALPVALSTSELCKNVTFVSYYQSKDLKKKITQSSNKINFKLFHQKNYKDISKNRFIDINTKKKFFEFYKFNNMEYQSLDLKNYLNKSIRKFDKVIVCDFGHGLLNNEIIKIIQKKSKYLCLNVQTNSGNRGYNLFKKYDYANLLMLDEPEVRLGLQDRYSSLTDIIKNNQLKKFKDLIITRGIKGLAFRSMRNKSSYLSFKALNVNAIDTMGAGDAAFAYSCMFFNNTQDKLLTGLLASIAGAIKTTIVGHESIVNNKQVERTLESILKK